MTFAAQQAQTFISAALGSVITNAVANGLKGGTQPIALTNSIIGGLQMGTNWIAYDLAINCLKKHNIVKKNLEDPKGNKVLVYFIGGVGAGVVSTLINYPLSKLQTNLSGQSSPLNVKEFFKTLGQNIPGTVGFNVAFRSFNDIIPTPKDSLGRWVRNQGVSLIGGAGSRIGSLPLNLSNNIGICQQIHGFIEGIVPTIVQNDATKNFKEILGFITD
uniref:Uncharacterized protein n=1 Tax=Coptotermes formosanus TaxID=36987 RepID=R4UXH4_COPFO|nr:hypothetical protein [Coptotermes formosanus]